MHTFVKIQAENSVIEKLSHKKCYSPEFYGYIMDHNFCNTQEISMKFGRYLKEDMSIFNNNKNALIKPNLLLNALKCFGHIFFNIPIYAHSFSPVTIFFLYLGHQNISRLLS